MPIHRVSLALAIAALLAPAWALALPDVAQVRSAVAQGHYAQAESMMREVVAAKPDSPRAHYVLAEILAHEQRYAEASTQAQRAAALDPSLAFTEPAKFRAFAGLLDREQAGERARGGAGTVPA
ncbi:MAG: tetratricopeptide repeat protein, partial [Burkholderiales bacterium]|nr:tetratricopeptide repeat protein [Burkholderiales bacterium]